MFGLIIHEYYQPWVTQHFINDSSKGGETRPKSTWVLDLNHYTRPLGWNFLSE